MMLIVEYTFGQMAYFIVKVSFLLHMQIKMPINSNLPHKIFSTHLNLL